MRSVKEIDREIKKVEEERDSIAYPTFEQKMYYGRLLCNLKEERKQSAANIGRK